MNRFLLFGKIEGAEGWGWDDFIGSYKTYEQAMAIAQHWQKYQIVDTKFQFGKIVGHS